MAEPTTTALLRDLAQGRHERFAALYQRLAPRLFLWCTLRVPAPLRARLDPEDLMQEIWVRALDGLERFDGTRARFRSWLFGIAANTLAENLRRLYLRRREVGTDQRDPDSPLADLPADVTSVVQQVARSERLHRLLAAAAQLEVADQRLLLHRGVEGLPHAEVAHLLGISSDAAEIRWRRLRERLRSTWSAAGLDET